MTGTKMRPDRTLLTEVLRRAGVPDPGGARVEEMDGGTFNTAYRCYLHLVMAVEAVPRGTAGPGSRGTAGPGSRGATGAGARGVARLVAANLRRAADRLDGAAS